MRLKGSARLQTRAPVTLVLWVLCLLGALPAAAAENTLIKLSTTQRVTLGASDHTLPVSSLNADGVHVGYHLDVCQRIVEAIRQRFDMPGLKAVTVSTTQATRFAMLNNGTTDIDCGDNPVTAAGLQQALYTHATLITDLRLMTVIDKKGYDVVQFDGATLGLTVGSSAVPLLRARARSSQIKLKELFARQPQETFALLEAGRVEAIALATPYLLAQRDMSADPSRYVVLDMSLRAEPVAITLRLADEELLAIANEVIAAMMRTGALEQLYNKWFMESVPGLRQPLNLPMSSAMRGLFKQPGSEKLAL